MAEYNWYGWSSFKEIRVKRSGLPDQVVTQNYDDTFSVAVGAQYKLNEAWTVRSGFQYDETPTVNGFRSSRTPDGDRYWLSAGLSYDVSDNFTVDVAYTHVFIDDADIDTRQPGVAAALSTNTQGGQRRQRRYLRRGVALQVLTLFPIIRVQISGWRARVTERHDSC